MLLERHGSALDRVLVVLPGRRAGLHLRKYLAQRAGHALWSPEMLDPGSFLQRVAGWRQGSPSELLLLLHECHGRLQGARAQPIAEFLEWAPATLRDLSEADAHLLVLKDFYRDLRNYHEIEWSLRDTALSPSQERANEQWRLTGALHQAFQAAMAERAIGTAGAIGREAARRSGEADWRPAWDAVWVAGLNAIEPSLMAVLKALRQRGLLHLAWDADEHYLRNEEHEAGRFLRKAIRELGHGLIPAGTGLATHERTVVSAQLPDRMAMCRFAAQWARALPKEQRDHAAIVLADEQLLLPLLEVMPDDLGPMNVSLGIPVSALPMQGLVKRFLRLQAAEPGTVRIAEVIGLITHPLLHQGASTAEVVRLLLKPGWPQWERGSFLSLLQTSELPEAARKALAGRTGDPEELLQALFDWVLHARRSDPLAREQVFQLALLQREMRQALRQRGIPHGPLAEFIQVRERLLGQARISLFGEPLRGLQVVGMLETRALSFEQVLVLGASEGILIGQEEPQSWIPFDLRRHFKLPLRADSEAVASYHVHRLLHDARAVTLAHAPAADGSGIAARFVEQWRHELVPRSRTVVTSKRIAAPAPRPVSIPVRVDRGPAVQERLHALVGSGLSPSALSTWLRCPLDFYMKYVLGVRDPEDVEEGLGDDVLGTAVHRAAETIYRPWVGRPLDRARLLGAAQQAPEAVHAALQARFPHEMLATGGYLLRGSMAGQALSRLLHSEAQRADLQRIVPVAVEEELAATLRPGVRITGKADRIERRDGVLCVLDIKTGSFDAKQLRIDALERGAFDADKSKALQLLMYAAMVLHADPAIDKVRAGIIPLRKASRADGAWLQLEGDELITRDRLAAVDGLLLELIDELLDEGKPFEHDPESTYCRCCLT